MATETTEKPCPKGERKGRAPASKSKGAPGKKSGKGRSATHNDNAWYTKEGVPVVGANFAALQTIDPEQWTGLRTENIAHFEVAVVPPKDNEQSFWQKINEFYTEIRESNAGAANYATGVVADYILNLIVAYSIFYDLARKLHAVASSDPNAEMSAAAKSIAAGVYSYRDMASNFANRFNDLMLKAKELEVFPVVPLAAMERLKYYFGSIFKDSDNGKPAYFTFHAGVVAWFSDIAYDKQTDTVTHTVVTKQFNHSSVGGTWADEIKELENIIDSMMDNPVLTILRGDIRRAFGAASMRVGNITSYVQQTLEEARLDPELMSKMENANILSGNGDSNPADFTVSFDPNTGDTDITLPCDGVNDHNLNARADKQQVLINWHKPGAPTDAELCSITRMMTTADQNNALFGRTVWVVANTDGLILTNIFFVSAATMSSVAYVPYGEQVSQTQRGSLNNFRMLVFYMSTLDHAPQVFTTDSQSNVQGREYMWDIDNFAVIARSNVETIGSRVIRSLFLTHVPRGEHGRIERSA